MDNDTPDPAPDPAPAEEAADGPATTSSDDSPPQEDIADDTGRRGRRFPIRRINEATLGELTLHLTQRSVTMAMDGDRAMRILAVFGRGRADGFDDTLNPELALALDPWLGIDFSQVVMVTWVPGPEALDAVARNLSVRRAG